MLLEDRITQAVTGITGNMSLTEDMDDVEAAALLDWASRVVREVVLLTVEMEDAPAEAHLDPILSEVRRVMRRINDIIGGLSDLPAEELVRSLSAMFDARAGVPVAVNTIPGDFEELAGEIAAATRAEALTLILQYV